MGRKCEAADSESGHSPGFWFRWEVSAGFHTDSTWFAAAELADMQELADRQFGAEQPVASFGGSATPMPRCAPIARRVDPG